MPENSRQNSDAPLFDSRHDPRFQRGYRGDGDTASVSPEAPPEEPRVPARASVRRLSGVTASPRPEPPQEPRPPEERRPLEQRRPLEERRQLEDDSAVDDWEDEESVEPPGDDRLIPRRAGGSLAVLWSLGTGLILLGLVCVTFTSWSDAQLIGGTARDLPLLLLLSLAWQLCAPALLVGLATMIGAVVVRILLPSAGERS